MTARSDEKGVLHRELETLEQMRDELRVQAHLLKSDLKQELDGLDKKFDRLRQHASGKRIRRAGEESFDEISDATRLLLDTVRDGLTRIRKSLTAK